MNTRPKVALIGICGYGDAHLEALLTDPRSENLHIVGVADRAPQRSVRLDELAARRIPVFSNLPSLLGAGEIDLLIVATPIHFHAPHTCMAVQRGASVLCEKPLAGSWRDAMRMLAAERAARGFVAIGFQWSFSRAIQSLKQDIMDGVLGRAIRLKSIVSFPRGRAYFTRNDWAGRIRTADGDEVLDSPVNNATAHYLHNMLYLLGHRRDESAQPVSVQAELYRANAIENYDTACLRCEMEDGAEVLFYTTHAAEQRIGPRQSLEFEHATVTYDFLGTGQFVAQFNDGRTKTYGNPNADRHEKIWQAAAAVRSSRPLPCGVRASLPHLMCVLAAQESGIVDFPRSVCSSALVADDPMTVVRGLGETLVDCYDREVLPAEHGQIDWSQAADAVAFPLPAWANDSAEPAVAVV